MSEWMDADGRVERAHELYGNGRWVEAAAELRAAIQANPYNPSWHFNLGLTLEAMEDYVKACEAYQAARRLDPDDTEILNCLGVNLTRTGQYAEALECFSRIQKLDPDFEPSYCNRIVTYTELGQHEQAELMFYLARQVKDECPSCYFHIGNSHYARGQYDMAIDCWRQALRLDAALPQTHARIADAYWAKGDLEKAREHYEAEVTRAGDDPDAMLDLGEVLMELGRLDEARRHLGRVLQVAPACAAGFFCLGELEEMLGNSKAAERAFRRTMLLDRDYPGAHVRLARLLLRRGASRQAASHLTAELRQSDSDPESLRELGDLLIEARVMDKAHKVLTKLVSLVPDDAHARHNLAVSCFLMDRVDEGIRHCRTALKLRPRYPLALYNLALANLRKGHPQRARRFVSRAMTLAPNDENINRLARRLGVSGFWSRLRVRLVPRRKRSRRRVTD